MATVETAKRDGAFAFFRHHGATAALEVLRKGPLAASTRKGDPQDATALDNMLTALDYIDQCNAIRAVEGLSALQVSDFAMAAAMHNTNWSATSMEHSHHYGGENLAWGYGTPKAAFDGWYADEKRYYNTHVDKYPGARNMSPFQLSRHYPDFSRMVGHYLNIVDSSYSVTGFAVSQHTALYGIAAGQQFFFDSPDRAHTAAEYRRRLLDYCGAASRGWFPLLNFYHSSSRPGNFQREDYRLMVHDKQCLYLWHVNRFVSPNERLDEDQRRPVGDFHFHEGRWILVNRRLNSLWDKDVDRKIEIGGFVELTEGRKILLSAENGGRLIVVQLVPN